MRVAVEVTEVEEVMGEEEVIVVDVAMQEDGEVEVMKIEEVVEEAVDTKEEGGAHPVGAVEELEVVVEEVAVAPVVAVDDPPTSQSGTCEY